MPLPRTEACVSRVFPRALLGVDRGSVGGWPRVATGVWGGLHGTSLVTQAA